MRFEIPKNRRKQIAQDPEQDVYFWDGQVCVRSSVITVGNPPINTISVQNLHGVAYENKPRSFIWPLFFGLLGFVFLMTTASLFISSSATGNDSIGLALAFPMLALTTWFFYKALASPASHLVTLKMGGLLGDEIFSSKSKEWAEKFSHAVSQAIMIEQHRRGGGGQAVYQPEPIFPDPTHARN